MNHRFKIIFFLLAAACLITVRAGITFTDLHIAGTNSTVPSGAVMTVNSGATVTFDSGSTLNLNGTVAGTPSFGDIGIGTTPLSTSLIAGSLGSGESILHVVQGSSETSGVNLLDLATTWNNSGNTPTAFKLNITDTASNSGSLLQDFKIGGTSKWSVRKDGTLTVGIVPVTAFNGGTGASSSTYLRGDGTWSTPSFAGSSANLLITGTAGSGYVELQTQSADVTGGSLNNLRLFSDSNGYLSVVGNSGNIARFTLGSLTSNHLFTLPNSDGTLQLSATSAAGYGITNGNALDTFAALASNGLVVRNGSSYATASVTAGTDISISNGNGVSGNPTVSLITSPTLTTPIIAGGLTASGSGSNDFSGSTGTFKTSTGANTLSGAVTINDATTPSITTASGKTNTGFVQINGKTSGALKIIPADAAAQTVTLNLAAQTSGASTVTIPDMAGTSDTLAFLAKTQTLTNKTISGSSNTLSNIANASLTNSSITIQGSPVSLGGSVLATNSTPTFGAETLSQVTATPPTPLTNTYLEVVGKDGDFPGIAINSFTNGVSDLGHGEFSFIRANGTSASPSAVLSGNALGAIHCYGYGTSQYSTSMTGAITFHAAENWTNTANGTSLTIRNTPNGTTTITDAAIFGQDQSLSVLGTVDSTSPSTGALIVSGGGAFAKSVQIGGTLNVNDATASNPSPLTGTLLHLTSADGVNNRILFDTFNGTPAIIMRRAQGTSASPSAITASAFLTNTAYEGYDGSAYASAVNVIAQVPSTWTTSNHESTLSFQTTPNGSTTPAAALTLGSNQSASIGGTGDSTSTSTGSLVTAGGAGIAKSLYVGGSASILGGVGIGGSVNAGDIVDFIQPTTGPGTISVTASSGSVTGSGTSFFSTFRVGQTITANSETHTIAGVSSNTALTTDNWTNSASTQAYTLAGGLKAFISGNGELNFGSASAGIAFPIGDTAIQVVRTATDLGSTSANIYTYYTGDILSETRAAFTGQLIGYASTPQIGGSNTQNWTQSTLGGGIVGGWFSPSFGALGGSGNVTTASAIYARLHIGTANNLTNGYGLWVEKFHTDGSAWTNAVGVAIDDQNAGTNNTDLLLGTVTAPTGNYALYSASIYPSAFAGPVSSSSTIQPIVTIVSSLPSASPAGQTACVTDASTTVALGLGLVVTGGGANFSPVYSDGTNWRQY